MTIANGVAKKVRMKREAVYGVANGPLGARDVRRITSDLSLKKDSYESKEIRTDAQVADMRHGMRKIEGSIKSEINPGDQADFIAAIMRRDFTVGATTGSASIAVVADGFTRAAGSFITDGFKVGRVVRAVGLVNAVNNGNNFIVLGVTALKLTGQFLRDDVLVAEAAAPAVTIAEVGKSTFVPKVGHKQTSFAIEHFFEDVSQSELFTGLKVSEIGVNLPSTGMAEFDVKFLGKAMTPGAAPYFTDSAEAGTAAALAAVNGRFFIAGSRITTATSLQFTINGNASTESVIGSNTSPEVFSGRVQATGSVTAFFENGDLRDAFMNETEQAVIAVFTASNDKNADFIAIVFPRTKLGSADKDDGEKGVLQTFSFTALRGVGAVQENTTIAWQDSLAA